MGNCIMPKPYVEAYENENGDVVLLYIKEASYGRQVEPEAIVIDAEHIEQIISELKEFV